MPNKYYQILTEDRTAEVNIYGYITSWPMKEAGEVSAYNFVKDIQGIDADVINVYINSPGGEVAEALAIYNALKRHPAQIHTFCDGLVASAATIPFLAGDIRTAGEVGIFMIHNAAVTVFGNPDELRKAAEDTEKWNQQSINLYVAATGLPEEKIREMMDAETYLTMQEALKLGFATEIVKSRESEVTQSGFAPVQNALLGYQRIRKEHPELFEEKKGDDPNLGLPEQTENETAAFFGCLTM